MFQCGMCEAFFSTKEMLDAHFELHPSDVPFRTFTTTHDRGDQLKCELCTEIFSSEGDLEVHLQIHNSIKKEMDETVPRIDLCAEVGQEVREVDIKEQCYESQTNEVDIKEECYESPTDDGLNMRNGTFNEQVIASGSEINDLLATVKTENIDVPIKSEIEDPVLTGGLSEALVQTCSVKKVHNSNDSDYIQSETRRNPCNRPITSDINLQDGMDSVIIKQEPIETHNNGIFTEWGLFEENETFSSDNNFSLQEDKRDYMYVNDIKKTVQDICLTDEEKKPIEPYNHEQASFQSRAQAEIDISGDNTEHLKNSSCTNNNLIQMTEAFPLNITSSDGCIKDHVPVPTSKHVVKTEVRLLKIVTINLGRNVFGMNLNKSIEETNKTYNIMSNINLEGHMQANIHGVTKDPNDVCVLGGETEIGSDGHSSSERKQHDGICNISSVFTESDIFLHKMQTIPTERVLCSRDAQPNAVVDGFKLDTVAGHTGLLSQATLRHPNSQLGKTLPTFSEVPPKLVSMLIKDNVPKNVFQKKLSDLKRNIFVKEALRKENILASSIKESQLLETAFTNLLCNKTPSVTEHQEVPIKESFSCEICSFVFKNKRSLKNHESTCSHKKALTRKQAIDFAMKKVSVREFKCELCSKSFSTIDNLQKHHCICEKHSCDICSQSFSTIDVLQRHYELCKSYCCKICSLGFSSARGLQGHNSSCNSYRSYVPVLPRKRTIICSLDCLSKHNKPVTITKQQKISTKRTPTGNFFFCKFCNVAFTNNIGLKRHEATRSHQRQLTRNQANYFERIRTSAKAFSCEICSQSFLTLVSLQKHNEHCKAYCCNICSENFTTLESLQNHTKVCKVYSCDICWRRFNTSDSFDMHSELCKALHCCEVCGKRFKTFGNLLRHTGLCKALHCCQVCSKSFDTLDSLQKHTELCKM